MQDISVIISTQTKEGIVRQKAKVNKSSKYNCVTINGILVPKVKSFGMLTMTAISKIVTHPDQAKETEQSYLDMLKRTEIAKKANETKAKPKRKKAKRKPKASKAKAKAKPKKERLPKDEYFVMRAEQAFANSKWDKVKYYLGRLKAMELSKELQQWYNDMSNSLNNETD